MKIFFAYGTLIFQEIIYALNKKQFKIQNVVLKNYRKTKIFDGNKFHLYPTILKSKDNIVKGKILFDVDEKSKKIFNFFEGSKYIKKKLIVKSKNKTFEVLYVLKDKFSNMLNSEWNEYEFKEKYLEFYVNNEIPKILEKYKEYQKTIL